MGYKWARSTMAFQAGWYDPEERRREKQLSRENDEVRLRSGRINHEDLRRENGFFSKFDMSKSVIVRRKARVPV